MINIPRPSSARAAPPPFRSELPPDDGPDPQQVIAEDRQDEDAVQESDQAEVQPHVAVEDVAELVPHHALQFVAVEILQAAAGDGHHGVGRGVSGGEGVDAPLVVEHVDRRDGNPGGQGHLLDHVQQPPLGEVLGVRIDQPAAEHQGHRLAARGKLGDLVQAPQGDHPDRAQANPAEHHRVPQAAQPAIRLARRARAAAARSDADPGMGIRTGGRTAGIGTGPTGSWACTVCRRRTRRRTADRSVSTIAATARRNKITSLAVLRRATSCCWKNDREWLIVGSTPRDS